MIFFGWFIVAASVVLTGYNSAMFVYGLTAFITPMTVTSGWSYTQVSLATSIRGLEIGALDPLAGIIVDRWPARRLMLLGTIVFVGGVIIISQAGNLAVFYAGFLIAGLGSSFCHNIVPMTTIARWFKKNVGKATGILSMGMAVGGLCVPLMVKAIDTWGWQDVMLYMAAGGLVLGIPISLLFRNRPEEYGMLPDGQKTEELIDLSTPDPGVTTREAVRMRAFWIISVVGMLQMTVAHAVTVHMVPYLSSLGMDRSYSAIGITIFSVVSLVMRVTYGVLADMFPKKYVYALSNTVMCISLVIFGTLDGSSFAMLALFTVIYGMGISGAMPLRVPVTREYFGVRSFGTIYGLLSVSTVIGGIIGAPAAASVYDATGSYFPIWYVFAGLNFLNVILLMFLPPVKKIQPGLDNVIIG